MPSPTLQPIRDKLAELETATEDRETKRDKNVADQAALQVSIDNEAASRDEWLTALRWEHGVEDSFEALVLTHEPPAVPE